MDVLLVVLAFGCVIHTVLSGCNTVYPGSPTFGPDCKYRCRCNDDVQCDVTSGKCPEGCAFGWMGPACQYRNIIASYSDVRQFGASLTEEDGASMAVDGDVSTCSWTDPRNYEGRQYWMVELDREYRVAGLVLHIPESDIDTFAEFRIEFGHFWSTFTYTCYEHIDSPITPKMEVICGVPTVTQYVRVSLNTSNVPLRLCEIEIYGGRVISFNRPASGTTSYQNWLPYKAVDGRHLEPTEMTEEARSRTCYASVNVQKPSLKIDFGALYDIHDLYYYGRENKYLNQMQGFAISVGDESSNFSLLYEDNTEDSEYVPKMTDFTEVKRGYSVKITKTRSALSQLAVCEIVVFGDCPVDKCGWDCSVDCHCLSSHITGQHKISGTCPDGCRSRWTGENGRCDTECCPVMWGTRCDRMCGHCDGMACDIFDGTCPTGCEGARRPPLCLEDCEKGTYGVNCSYECGHCTGHSSCDGVTGYCLPGCEEGWTPPLCNEEEDEYMFTTEVGIGAGFLVLIVLAEAVTIVIICRRRRPRLAADTAKEAIQTVAFTKEGPV